MIKLYLCAVEPFLKYGYLCRERHRYPESFEIRSQNGEIYEHSKTEKLYIAGEKRIKRH